MSEQLSDEMQADLKELFSLADTDGSGVLSTKELRWVRTHLTFVYRERRLSHAPNYMSLQVMQSLGRTPTEVELAEIVTQMDTDGNGTLDVNEFMALMARKFKETDTMEEVLESFKVQATLFIPACGGGE